MQNTTIIFITPHTHHHHPNTTPHHTTEFRVFDKNEKSIHHGPCLISPDAKHYTCRCSRITLLSDPAAKLMRMKVLVFLNSASCLGVSDPDPSNYWATTWSMCGRNIVFFMKNCIWQPEKENSFFTHYQVLLPWTSGGYGAIIERAKSRIFRSSTTLNGQRKAIQKLVCTMPK